jgi:glutathione S-transferase kappa 1
MAVKRVPVKLFYDVISPYSYFAFETIVRYKSLWNKMDLQLKPVHLFALLKASDNSPPVLNEIKRTFHSSLINLNHY